MTARRSVVMLLALVLVGCGPAAQDPPSPTASVTPPATTATRPPTTSPSSPSPSTTPLDEVELGLQRIATLEQPVALAVRDGDDVLYVSEKVGTVRALRDEREDVVLDISDEVSLGYEQGLLGMAFSPDGSFLYVNYTDVEGDTQIEEFPFRDSRADIDGRRRVLSIDQPFPNHNGGNLAFGPDGYLYIGMGDGGSGFDPLDNGQSLDTLLGKMLRIDPRPSGDRGYGIPGDNPFLDREGVRPEIWAYGLRNPWRYSFDRETGDLWIGDVGQHEREEISFQPASSAGGENYGWNRMEGTVQLGEQEPEDHVPPVHEYPTDQGCVVTGGYVYRGSRIPGLVGAYVFADFCTGVVRGLRLRDGEVAEEADLGPTVSSLGSFGEDAEGELYALSLDGPIYRLIPES